MNGKYQFLDLGTKMGASLRTAARRRKTTPDRGVGIDLRERFLRGARWEGLTVLKMNAEHLGFKDKAFAFTWVTEFLEHLDGPEQAVVVLREVKRVTRNSIFIQNPNFEHQEQLSGIGLKFCWSDWGAHNFHITAESLREVLARVKLRDVEINKTYPVSDTTDPLIVPATAPTDTPRFDPTIHDPKPIIAFNPMIFSKLTCTVDLTKRENQ